MFGRCALIAAVIVAPHLVVAAPGDLDVTFGIAGKVVTVVGTNTTTFTQAVAVQGDGRIVAVGRGVTLDPLTFHVVLARYQTNGALDPTFGAGGVVVTTMASPVFVSALLLQSDGKMVVVGTIDVGGAEDWIIMRYAPDGSLDGTFGTGGITTTSFSAGDDAPRDAALQGDGRIVVVGTQFAGTNGSDIALARYDPDGLLDPAFGSGGMVVTNLGGSEGGNGVVVQGDGRIVVGGGRDAAVLVRYLDDGSLDGTFGTGGVVSGSALHAVFDVALQAGGRVVAGVGPTFAAGGGTLIGYDASGTIDSTFGVNGSVALPSVLFTSIFGSALKIAPDGNLLVSGSAAASNALARYDAFGTYDPTFGICGLAITAFEGAFGSNSNPLAIQTDGRILLGGWVTSVDGSLRHMALARFGSAGSSPACTAAATGKSRLTLKLGDKTKWKWVGPAPLVKADFGTPTAGTDLTFCVLDQATGSPISVLTIAGTTAFCAMSNCWTETTAGFVGNRRWTGRLRMKALAPVGAPGKIVVTGRAAPAGTPDPPLATPLVARMTRGDGGGCWEATFSSPIRNGLAEGFVAYSD